MDIPKLDNDHDHVMINSSSEREKWCRNEFLHTFHGFWFIPTYLETTQKVLQNLKPLHTDIILASFPKTGTNWLKALLHSIIHRSSTDDSPLIFNHPRELIPTLETNVFVRGKSPIAVEDSDEQTRILATHIPYQILGDVLNSSDCKIVYVTRNPKDTLVSLWHFVHKSKKIEQDPWAIETAVDQFCRGVVPFGPYYDHVLAYREESLKRSHKVFFVTYEELKENPKNCVGKIAEFLGCPFEGENGDVEIEEIVKNCSFETVSNLEVNKSSEFPPDGFPWPYNSFFRKGEVGDHVNYLEDEMIQKIDAITREKFHGVGFLYGI